MRFKYRTSISFTTFTKPKVVQPDMQQNEKSGTTKDWFVSFIENSFALEPLQDQVRPCLPTECLERRTQVRALESKATLERANATNLHREKQQIQHQDHMLSHSNHKLGRFHQQQTTCKKYIEPSAWEVNLTPAPHQKNFTYPLAKEQDLRWASLGADAIVAFRIHVM